MLRFEIVDDKYSEMVASMIRESFKEQAKILGINQEKSPNYYERLGYIEVNKKRFATVPFEVVFLRKNI